jgi:hypothetical protein
LLVDEDEVVVVVEVEVEVELEFEDECCCGLGLGFVLSQAMQRLPVSLKKVHFSHLNIDRESVGSEESEQKSKKQFNTKQEQSNKQAEKSIHPALIHLLACLFLIQRSGVLPLLEISSIWPFS